MNEKLNTYGKTLLWDLDRYISMCNFTELRLFFIELRKQGLMYEDILEEMKWKYGETYSLNYLASIVSTEIPKKIATVAKRNRLEVETPPDQRKKCIRCGRSFPLDAVFFSRNNAHKDGFSNTCKECDRQNRIEKGVISSGDLRKKDPTLPKM